MKNTFDETRYTLGTLCKRKHNWNNTGKSLRRKAGNHCLECRKVYCKNSQGNYKSHNSKVRQYCINLKGGKCEICNYNKCFSALDFHHVDPKNKSFGIATFRGSLHSDESLERLKAELDKCVLVCANCHREIHAGIVDISKVSVR